MSLFCAKDATEPLPSGIMFGIVIWLGLRAVTDSPRWTVPPSPNSRQRSPNHRTAHHAPYGEVIMTLSLHKRQLDKLLTAGFKVSPVSLSALDLHNFTCMRRWCGRCTIEDGTQDERRAVLVEANVAQRRDSLSCSCWRGPPCSMTVHCSVQGAGIAGIHRGPRQPCCCYGLSLLDFQH